MDDDPTPAPTWLPELMQMVRTELVESQAQQLRQQPDLNSELEVHRQKLQGWKLSLANPNLKLEIRNALEADWAAAEDRIRQIEQTCSTIEHREELANQLLDESEVLQRLDKLSDVLVNYSPTRGNLELSLHIDRITCSHDGKVEVRTCKLGSLPGVAGILAEVRPEQAPQLASNNLQDIDRQKRRQTGPRRRGELRITDDDRQADARDVAAFVADPHRFANLDEKWFWIDTFQVPVKRSWVEENAEAVLRRYREIEAETGKPPSLNKLARELGTSRPTVKTAIDIATGKKVIGGKRTSRPRKFTSPLDENMREKIVQLYCDEHEHIEEKEIADRLGVHRSTVTRILNDWDRQRGEKRPDGRRRRGSRKTAES